jgi:transcriptional regulator with XRE-family HTH domain
MRHSEHLDAQHIGRTVREARQRRHLSRAGLAAQAGVARSTLIRLEDGHHQSVRTATLFAVARALGVPAARLLRWRMRPL